RSAHGCKRRHLRDHRFRRPRRATRGAANCPATAPEPAAARVPQWWLVHGALRRSVPHRGPAAGAAGGRDHRAGGGPAVCDPAPENHRVILETRAVTARYRGAERPALDRVSCAVAEAQLVAVVGPNGSGKTTLVRVITGLLALEQG